MAIFQIKIHYAKKKWANLCNFLFAYSFSDSTIIPLRWNRVTDEWVQASEKLCIKKQSKRLEGEREKMIEFCYKRKNKRKIIQGAGKQISF